MMNKIGILVVNLGTPNSPETKDVKQYLNEFLMDGRVIDLPFIKRFLLVRGIIVPFRAPKVAHEYKKLWLKEGSPLLVYGQQLVKGLNKLFTGQNVVVELAMRYQNPSIQHALENLQKQGVDKILVFPLFPQYASATTGSVTQKVMEVVSQWNVIPEIEFLHSYHQDRRYIQVFADKVKADIQKHRPDHILFSYHGVPQRHIDRIDHKNQLTWNYQEACKNTSDLIARRVGLDPRMYTTSFQSRLGKDPWIQPYTDNTIRQLTEQGVKNLLVVSPSFVADCLETTLEIGEEYRDLFFEHGGKEFNFTESLNAERPWIKAIYEIITDKLNIHENFNTYDLYNNKFQRQITATEV